MTERGIGEEAELARTRGAPLLIALGQRLENAEARSEILDFMGATVRKYFLKYPSGLLERVIAWREENRDRLLRYFGGSRTDWDDPVWQLRHVIRDARPLLDLIELTTDQRRAVERAATNGVPFGITPYYLSLMDRELTVGYDHAVRAQVIPPPDYVDTVIELTCRRCVALDFMGEHDTSPVPLITRRYPRIASLQPFNTCAQICVYCQRNWEIDEVLSPKAAASKEDLERALEWFDHHRAVGDVLVTGGDPCIMPDSQIEHLLDKVGPPVCQEPAAIGCLQTPVRVEIGDAKVAPLGSIGHHAGVDREKLTQHTFAGQPLHHEVVRVPPAVVEHRQ